MSNKSYNILHNADGTLLFVEMPATHAYQLSALNLRLHKELAKLTADNVPALPKAVAECASLELLDENASPMNGLAYLNELEASFSAIRESAYPLVSLLTEIRALQAQLEQWYEEEEELSI
ncbi:hydrolase/acyltransferase [Cohnella fermenti]|uniref:Hydrolase/acyltransferase n=1 Tax=Cohnella fermenti TaxID=2565925 RepID=A0A4S4BHF0_9BACL|nr:hydrolase/acyltransferase [Cohnella fermenti]THF73966.1 hydrolase/acyltransferase [Cohnella fermenti]